MFTNEPTQRLDPTALEAEAAAAASTAPVTPSVEAEPAPPPPAVAAATPASDLALAPEPQPEEIEIPNIEGYDSFSLIGRGGMATVWRARQISLDRLVALKVLDAEHAASEEDLDRFQSEARAAARLNHPGLVQVYDAFCRHGRFCLSMELVESMTLTKRLRKYGAMTERQALSVGRAVAEALHYAWDAQKLIHCDIKPENILITDNGVVKIADFGLSRSLVSIKARANAEHGMVLGTPAYMSPEQCMDSPNLGPQADMYSLGAMLYHVVTGRRLFEGRGPDETMRGQVSDVEASPLNFVPNLSEPFVKLLRRLLAKDPQARHKTWSSVLRDIQLCRDGEDIYVPDPTAKSTIAENIPAAPAAAAPVYTLPKRRPQRLSYKSSTGASEGISPTWLIIGGITLLILLLFVVRNMIGSSYTYVGP